MKKFTTILVFLLIISINVQATDDTSALKDKLNNCTKILDSKYDSCPDSWSMKCYKELIDAHHNVQNCYKEIAVELFIKFYELSPQEATKRFDTFSNAIYEQYQFVFGNTNYCKNNNCGIGIHLYTNYVTSEELHNYVNKIINSVEARN